MELHVRFFNNKDPDLKDLWFPDFYSSLFKELHAENESQALLKDGLDFLDVLEKEYSFRFAARLHFTGVPYESQLYHSLSPEHLAVHNLTLMGPRCKDTSERLENGIDFGLEMSNREFSASLRMHGPLIFQFGPTGDPNMISFVIPTKDGHILEMASVYKKRSSRCASTAIAANTFAAFPFVFEAFVQRGFFEDLKVYERIRHFADFRSVFDRLNNVSGSKEQPDAAIRKIYFSKYFKHENTEPVLVSTGFMQKAHVLGCTLLAA